MSVSGFRHIGNAYVSLCFHFQKYMLALICESMNEQIPTEKQLNTENPEQSLKEKFNAVLAGRFDDVPNGNYLTELPGIDSITIFRGENALSVVIYYDNHKRHETLSLFSDGVLSGRIPKKLDIDNDQVLAEVIRIADSVDIGAWHHVDDDILPPGFWPKQEEKDGEAGKEKQISMPRTDSERIKFLTGQEDFLFGFDGRNSGFQGYYGYVFPWGIVLENDMVGNAAYFIDFDTPIAKDDAGGLRVAKRGERASLEQKEKVATARDEIISRYWKPMKSVSKYEALQRGHKRLIHGSKNWTEEMAKAIAVRRKTEL